MAVVTDARFSGVSTGACIGHVGPEALAGGPIGKLRDGDLIRIDDRSASNSTGSIDFVAAASDPQRHFGPEEAAAELARRSARIAACARSARCPTTRGCGPRCNGQRRHLGRLRV